MTANYTQCSTELSTCESFYKASWHSYLVVNNIWALFTISENSFPNPHWLNSMALSISLPFFQKATEVF